MTTTARDPSQESTPPKPRGEKRPETRVRDALRLVEKNSGMAGTCRSGLEAPNFLAKAEEVLEQVELRAKQDIARARATRDFAREIQGLTGVHLGSLRGGLDAIAPPNPQTKP